MLSLSGVKRLFPAVSLLVYVSAISAAEISDPPLQGIDYSKIEYEWTDPSGRGHSATLADKADSYEQIVALLKEVYVNPSVPGFIYDKAYDLAGAIKDENRNPGVKYAPAVSAPYNMSPDMKVSAPVEGATALLVEMNDDYRYVDGVSAEELLRQVKAVQVLSSQLYIGEKDGSTNPGYLFNYVGTLNKFFIITKGCNRVPEKHPEGFAPFYMMYEEFSPSNKGPIFGAYDAMNDGEQFAVDHNCSTVLGQNHLIAMSPEDSDENHQVNMLFYLPDFRFAGDSRCKDESPEKKYEWYTYYDSAHRPFVFFSKINAEINERPVADNAGMKARVKVEWKSTYKDVSRSKVPERFLVYRVVNGVIEPDPVPESDIEVDTSLSESRLQPDGSVVSQDDVVKVWITEPMHLMAYDVHYIVKGRRWGSDFEYTESNRVDATIPTVVPSTGLEIKIGGDGKSEYDYVTERNMYSNPIRLLDSDGKGANVLRRKHLRIQNADGDGSMFVLRRTVLDDNGNPVNPEDVAWMEVIGEDDSKRNEYVYDALITYPDGRTDKTQFKSAFNTNDRNLDGEMAVVALDGRNGVLADFIDKFAADTHNGDQPANYGYYVQYYHSAVSTHDGDGDDKPTVSNMVQVNVPVRDLKVGFRPYTESEVAADRNAEDLLPATLPVIRIDTRSNPEIKEYVVTLPEEGNRTIAKVARTATGSFQLSAADRDGRMRECGVMADDAENKPVVEVLCDIKPTEQVSLTLVYSDGNTYGNRRVVMPASPAVQVDESLIAKTGLDRDGLYGYGTFISWHADGADAADAAGTDDEFTVHGYRAWVKNDTDNAYVQKFGLDGYSSEESALPTGRGRSEQLIQGFLSHKAEPANPVTVDHLVRMYTVIPERHRVFSGASDAEAKYAVADTDIRLKAINHDDVVTGIESVGIPGDEGEYTYYDLAGRRVDASGLTRGVYIRTRGGKSEKIIM